MATVAWQHMKNDRTHRTNFKSSRWKDGAMEEWYNDSLTITGTTTTMWLYHCIFMLIIIVYNIIFNKIITLTANLIKLFLDSLFCIMKVIMLIIILFNDLAMTFMVLT